MADDDELRYATPGQVQAARRFFARHPRPRDRWARFQAAEAEERKQDVDHEWKGGNA